MISPADRGGINCIKSLTNGHQHDGLTKNKCIELIYGRRLLNNFTFVKLIF